MVQKRSDRRPTEFDGSASRGFDLEFSGESSFFWRLVRLASVCAIVVLPVFFYGYQITEKRFRTLEQDLNATRELTKQTLQQFQHDNSLRATSWVKIGEISRHANEANFANLTNHGQGQLERDTGSADWKNCGNDFMSWPESIGPYRTSAVLNIRPTPFTSGENPLARLGVLPKYTEIRISKISCMEDWIWASIQFGDG